MTANVIAFPRSAAQPSPAGGNSTACPTIYRIKWVAESGAEGTKSTTDTHAIRLQLESCRKRGLYAQVTAFKGPNDFRGLPCGGVHAITTNGVKRWQAHFQEISWED